MPSTSTATEAISHLTACTSLVLDALGGRLADEEERKHVRHVLDFPADLDAAAIAARLHDELTLASPADGWHDSLPPALLAELDRDPAYWLEPVPMKEPTKTGASKKAARTSGNGFYPRIIEAAGNRKSALRQRYDSQQIWHRWRTKPADCAANAFYQRAAAGVSFGDPGEWRLRVSVEGKRGRSARLILAKTVADNFNASLLKVVLNRPPFTLGLRLGSGARLVCPVCTHGFIRPHLPHGKYGPDFRNPACPHCKKAIQENQELYTIEAIDDFWYLQPEAEDGTQPLFIPALVWPCAGEKCGHHFPLPRNLGQITKPDKSAKCPRRDCCHGHRQNPKRLLFYVEPPPPPEPEPGVDVSVAAGTVALEERLGDLLAEATGQGVPGWALTTHVLQAAATTLEPVGELLGDGAGGVDWGKLHAAVLVGGVGDALRFLLGSGDAASPFQVLPAPRPWSPDVRPPGTAREFREEFEQRWQTLIHKIAREQAGRSPEDRLGGAPYFEDGDGLDR